MKNVVKKTTINSSKILIRYLMVLILHIKIDII